jgi:hypothetical protein
VDLTNVMGLVENGLLLWLGLLAAFVLRGILTGAINTSGLLSDERRGDIAPQRVALLLATLSYAAFYVTTALRASPNSGGLPDVPDSVLTVLLGTNGLYLTGKIAGIKNRG